MTTIRYIGGTIVVLAAIYLLFRDFKLAGTIVTIVMAYNILNPLKDDE